MAKGFNTMKICKKMCIIRIHSLCNNLPVSNTTKRQQQKIKLKRYCVFNLKFCTFVITCFLFFFYYYYSLLAFYSRLTHFSPVGKNNNNNKICDLCRFHCVRFRIFWRQIKFYIFFGFSRLLTHT